MIASNMGAGATAISTAQTIDTIKTGADVASVGATNKTLTDHAISYVVGKDCRMLNVLEKKAFCRVHKTYEVHFHNPNGVAFYWIAPVEPTVVKPKPEVIKPKSVKIKYKKKPKRKR